MGGWWLGHVVDLTLVQPGGGIFGWGKSAHPTLFVFGWFLDLT